MGDVYTVLKVRRQGQQVISEHLHLSDAILKATHVWGTVIVDQHGKVVPYDKS